MFMFQICLEIVSMYPCVSKPEWNIKITLNYLMVHLCSTNVFLEAKSGVSTGSWPLISAKERIQRIIRGRPAFGTAMGCNSGLRTAVSGFEVFRQERLRFLSSVLSGSSLSVAHHLDQRRPAPGLARRILSLLAFAMEPGPTVHSHRAARTALVSRPLHWRRYR